MSKSKTCFEILVKKAFRWHLETLENQIGSIFKLNIKKKCQIPKKNLHHACYCQGVGVQVALFPGHSMATANLKKSEDFVTNTTAASKYIPRRPRISIN
jgi:hypothetical protein